MQIYTRNYQIWLKWLPIIALSVSSSIVHADTFITSDTTQNGGTFSVTSPTLVVSHASNNPTLTLTNSATTSGAQALIVGSLTNESGRLELLNGSTITTSSPIHGLIKAYGSINVFHKQVKIGLNTNATGYIRVSGTGSLLTPLEEMSVGDRGTGTLEIDSGGRVSTIGIAFLGRLSGAQGHVIVDGANSAWAHRNEIEVGRQGTGSLTIRNGGTVTSAWGFVGLIDGSAGTVVVRDPGSSWTIGSNNLTLGGTFSSQTTATGTIDIHDGGFVTVASTTRVHGGGTVNLGQGGTLKTQHLNLSGGTFNFMGGTLVLTGGTVTGDVNIQADGVFTGIGSINGSIHNAGLVSPGSSPGTLSINGDFVNTGTIGLEINGLNPNSDYDQILITGNANLGGTIAVALGYTPSLGDSFQVITFSSLVDSGYEFDFSNALLSNGLAWDTSAFSSSGMLSIGADLLVVPEPMGLTMLILTALLIRIRRHANVVCP